MPIFNTVHDTFIDRSSILDKPRQACVDMHVIDQRLTHNASNLKLSDRNNVIGAITQLTTAEQQLPRMVHPFSVAVPSLGSEPAKTLLIGDVRPFVKVADKYSVVVSNVMEFQFMKARLGLTAYWMNGGVRDIYHLSACLVKIYSNWISDNITKRYPLDLQELVQTRIMAAHFFQCLHSPSTEITDTNRRATAAVLARNLNVGVNEVEAVIEFAGVITSVEDFLVKLKSWVNSPRYESLNIVTFSTIMASSWFGVGGDTTACAALEHPPTFAAMVYLAFNQRGYRNATLTRITDNFKGPKGENDLVPAVERILNPAT